MIRKRIPQQDDRTIYTLTTELLLPYARQTFPHLQLTPSVLRSRLEACSTYVVASAGRRPVAFITLRTVREHLQVDMLAVHQREQGRGVGSRLMRFAERYAGARGCREIRLWVDEANNQAQRFYMKHGYQIIHFDPNLKCYMMVKRL
ncbi:GNAT family N-acetyltransferase [Paenibacillus filicis]|uniref:GNAT family N-acetyltransferase n=1 Tax=Paenibacillus gyeongsangnamensis TaxID=3388067 RepID=A0ABT4QA48_9BACL|nr:GNAT family N-acetyltransferase [Paenibacillus filicis]MCZ8513651.1 GNAT family N-acetyltransferase [Paenibacillus filicis]